MGRGEREELWMENATPSSNCEVSWWFSRKLLTDREHPATEREAIGPGLSLNSGSWQYLLNTIQNSCSILNAWKAKGNTCYPEDTYAYDQAKKTKERKSWKISSSEKGEIQMRKRKGKERSRRGTVHLFASALPRFLLVVLDAFNFSSSGFNQQLTTSVRLEVDVIMVLEYRQICT